MDYLKSYTYPFDLDLIKSDNLGKSGVYLVLNNLNLDFYIGSAISISPRHNRIYFRFRNHFYHSHKNTNSYLYNAIKKYGSHNFSFHILEYTSIAQTRFCETNYIKEHKPKYNILAYGAGVVGYKHTKETKEGPGVCLANWRSPEFTNNLLSAAAKARSNTKEY